MSRLVPKEVSELMEAYSTVYSSQELTEEQVWEEVENWVNALIEEGHDLSEYTWEDMYEAYIEEQGRGTRTGSNPNVFRPTPSGSGSRRGAAPVPSSSSTGSVRTQPGTRTGSNPRVFTPTPSSQGSRRGAAPVPVRPAAPAARPAAPAPAARPAAPAPAARPAAPAPTARPAAPAVTSAPKPATPATPLQTAAKNLSGTGALAPAPKKPSLASQAAELRAMRQRSQERQGLTQSFDAFDVIKGHLLDEGYADTEEAALAIMTSMSEEWKKTILEADSVAKMAERAAKRRQQRYGKQGGGGRDDFRPYTEDDYKNPKPGYGSGAASQAKDA
jgi:hypothetical protein